MLRLHDMRGAGRRVRENHPGRTVSHVHTGLTRFRLCAAVVLMGAGALAAGNALAAPSAAVSAVSASPPMAFVPAVSPAPPAVIAGVPLVVAPQVAPVEQPASPPRQRAVLHDLQGSDFQHPWDVAATQALGKAKGLQKLTTKILELGPERYAAVNNVVSRVEISDQQLPEVYNVLKEAAHTLGMPVPRLFLEMDPYPNAYTSGVKEPFIVVTSSLLDAMNSDELLFVLGHELGHIKAGHVVYSAMVAGIATVLQEVGQLTLGLGDALGQGLQVLLLDWNRKAELSADRAGLLAGQDADVAVTVMMKLAGGYTPSLYGRLNRAAFLAQAGEYYQMAENPLSATYQALQTSAQTHPWPALRAAEILKWSKSQEYEDILRTHGTPAPLASSSPCGYSALGNPAATSSAH